MAAKTLNSVTIMETAPQEFRRSMRARSALRRYQETVEIAFAWQTTNKNNPDPETKPPAPRLPPQQDLIRKNARTGLAVLAAFLFMVGLSFASVPLYTTFSAG
jgi:hypothetical protein